MLSRLYILLARVRGFLRPGNLDHDFAEELAVHLELAEAEKIRQGKTPEEARRLARVELGGVAQLREAGRAVRGLPWLDSFCVDVKLGLRMLRKSWGLTAVGGLAMCVAFTLAVMVFVFLDQVFHTVLPLDDGARVVAIHSWEVKAHRRAETSLEDVARWKTDLRSLVEVGAFRTVERRITIGESARHGSGSDGAIETVRVAEISPSGFTLARVPALLGRTLLAEDEAADAPAVAVIGHDVWQERFAGHPAVLGQALRLDETRYTVVGVMPEGFAFPIYHHYWTALRAPSSTSLPPPPEAVAFARLAPGFTLESAQAELASKGLLPVNRPRDEPLDVRVVPYPFAFTGDLEGAEARWLVTIALILVTLLLVPPCANVAILVYARTLTRQEEFAARHALGASRGRIVVQLFVEMMVLAAVSAGLALVAVAAGLRWAEARALEDLVDGAPFWVEFGLPPRAVFFAGFLAVFAALITGLVPGLKATGGSMHRGLGALGSRNAGRLGATWTGLVVTQVALCLAVLPLVAEMTWGTIRSGVLGPGFPAEEYLTTRLTLAPEARDAEGAHDPSRFGGRIEEVVRQLAAEPGVLGVTVAAPPGTEPWRRIEIETAGTLSGAAAGGLARVNPVDAAFFDVLAIPLLAGRGFVAADFDAGRDVVVINRTLAELVVGPSNPLGRRIRIVSDEEAHEPDTAAPPRWHEIVGVVGDRPDPVDHGTMYRPAAAGTVYPAQLVLRAGTGPAELANSLRVLVAGVDSELRVDEVTSLDAIYRRKQVGNNIGASALVAVTMSVLLLSAAGMYALMSFTVNLRRREIGIRAALGARPWRLLAGVFQRAAKQLAAGAALGTAAALVLDSLLPAKSLGGWEIPGIVAIAAAFMMLVGLIATTGPARRGLRVDPIEELRNG